ncbi:MAG: Rieske 2Fe-2S domain-containing protein [Chitinophagaceae bacterium]
MAEKKYSWHKVADHINELDFSSNNIAVADLDGKKICIGRFKEAIFAFAYKCPHAGGLLADGHIDALGNVVCPLHRYKFNMQNGRNASGEGYYLKHWPVEQRDTGVFVGVEETGGFWGLFR